MAASLHRLGRELEHADHLARLLAVHLTLSLDRERAPEPSFWSGLARLAGWEVPVGLSGSAVISMLVSGGDGPSILGSLSTARQAAQGVRPSLSSEVWEHLNGLSWQLEETDWEGDVQDALSRVRTGVQLITGLAEESMVHDEAWDFLRLGRYLERATSVGRLVIARLVDGGREVVGGGEWVEVLRCGDGYEAYRWQRSRVPDAQGVVEFLLFEPRLPRSVVFSLQHALASVRRIDGPGSRSRCQRSLGRLAASFEYADPLEVTSTPNVFRQSFERGLGEVGEAVRATYFQPRRLLASGVAGEAGMEMHRQQQQ